MPVERPPTPLSALRPPAPSRTLEGVIAIARGELGVSEAAGDADNPRILEYQATTSRRLGPKFLHDSIAWCSSFVNWVFFVCGIKGTGEATARSWLTWGEGCALEDAWVVIFSRGVLRWNGHVAIPLRDLHTSQMVAILGGNQGNRVSIQQRPRTKLIGCRRPTAEMLRAA